MTGLRQENSMARAVPLPGNRRKGESGMKTQHRFKQWTLGLAVFSMAWIMGISSAAGQTRTYTLDADFDEGTLINVVHDPSDQLQLADTVAAFNFIWVAVSSKGTVVKIDTLTGAVLGEYRTTPQNQSLGNPSRTTVDKDGSVWVANRNNVSNDFGTIIHIGLKENGQCEDRHDGAGGGPDGIIQTSTGLGDVRGWTDDSGTRAIATALDECITCYTQVNSQGTRHVSVDANNDVWVSGLTLRNFDLVKGGRFDVVNLGTIIRSETSVGFGGYGGLIDPNGVIWSARGLLRWDVSNPLTGLNGDPVGNDIGPPIDGGNWAGQGSPDSYGLGIDSQGNVWNTQLDGNLIHKYAPDGTHLGAFPHGDTFAQGCVVDQNDDVWVAHTLFVGQNTVGHIRNDGTFVGNVTLDPNKAAGPTGVAVDAAGKIWATGFGSRKVYRIDPTLAGGVGAVDFTSVNLGGDLYNYSDMTGSTLTGAPDNGTWTIIHDCGVVDFEWGIVTWTPAEPGDSTITVTAASSNDGVNFGAPENVTNGVDLTVANGQFLKVVVSFTRATNLDSDGNGVNDSPILFDLTIECCEPVEDPDIRTQGFWKRVCRGPHPSGEHENLPGYVDCVNLTDTFADVGDVDALCERLTPDRRNDKCEQAEAQFMALLLNVCSGRVATCNCIDDPDFDTVGEAADFIDELLSNPNRTFDDCVLAQAIADDINNGLTLVDCP